jgi:pimeloyl-ACP methyl ester carboxylesterase
MQLQRRHQIYASAPRILGPLFLMETPFRLRAELKSALPERARRWAFVTGLLRTSAEAPVSLSRMAVRGRLMSSYDTRADCARITAPTLVITGQAELDRVVPGGAASEYARLIAGAELALLERTGHIGPLTRPRAFTRLVRQFVPALEADHRCLRRP